MFTITGPLLFDPTHDERVTWDAGRLTGDAGRRPRSLCPENELRPRPVTGRPGSGSFKGWSGPPNAVQWGPQTARGRRGGTGGSRPRDRPTTRYEEEL